MKFLFYFCFSTTRRYMYLPGGTRANRASVNTTRVASKKPFIIDIRKLVEQICRVGKPRKHVYKLRLARLASILATCFNKVPLYFYYENVLT